MKLSALGMVNALGSDTSTIWRRLQAGDQTGLSFQPGYLNDRPVLVGRVPDTESAFPESFKRYACRNNVLTWMAYRQIQSEVQRAIAQYGAARIGVVMGSSTSGMSATEAAFTYAHTHGTLPTEFDYVQHEMGGLAEFLAVASGSQGPAYVLSTACSSSAKVFASARALIRQGWCDAVLVGGADSLCRLTVQGFTALEALSSTPCNSMSRNRDGFNIGEGAAIFLLERGDGDVSLLGVGESSDAYQMTAPDPDGRGASAAMQAALQDARLRASDIAYLNLHGTGTVLNDAMESRAVFDLFAATPCSSSKGMIGHTLGAAGAMETGFCWLALNHMKDSAVALPPHCWDGQADAALPQLNLVTVEQKLEAQGKIAFMSNSFGFGGSNSSVIIGRSS